MSGLDTITRRTFWVRVEGDAMASDAIYKGDVLLVDAEKQASLGDLVLIREGATQRVAHYTPEVPSAPEAKEGSYRAYTIIAVSRSIPLSS
jgi:hypothetical protein